MPHSSCHRVVSSSHPCSQLKCLDSSFVSSDLTMAPENLFSTGQLRLGISLKIPRLVSGRDGLHPGSVTSNVVFVPNIPLRPHPGKGTGARGADAGQGPPSQATCLPFKDQGELQNHLGMSPRHWQQHSRGAWKSP